MFARLRNVRLTWSSVSNSFKMLQVLEMKKGFMMVINRPLHVHELVGNVGCLQGSDLEHDGVQREHRLGSQGHQAVADAASMMSTSEQYWRGQNNENFNFPFRSIPLTLHIRCLSFLQTPHIFAYLRYRDKEKLHGGRLVILVFLCSKMCRQLLKCLSNVLYHTHTHITL